jgi:hypothetical protein
MRSELEDWGNGWHGLRLSIKPHEIEHLIGLLKRLQRDPEQHFHIASDYSATGGLGDIEISVATSQELGNMRFGGLALAPGTDVPGTEA